MDERKPSDVQRAVASVIERRQAEIIEHWLFAVGSDAARREVDTTQLSAGITRYLDRVVVALRAREAIGPLATAWADVARDHALTRMRQGFDVEQLARELVHLRRAIIS